MDCVHLLKHVPITFSVKIHHSNEYLIIKIGFDTTETGPSKVCGVECSQRTAFIAHHVEALPPVSKNTCDTFSKLIESSRR